MRLSSPSIAAAFVDGATLQGADVVDYGMIPTDMLYFAVARDRHEGGVEITASHNPKQYNGMKMVRQEAFPLSGDEGISDIRDAIAATGFRPRPRGAARSPRSDLLDGVRRARHVVHRSGRDSSVQRRARCRERHGRSRRAEAVRAPPLQDHAPVLRDRRTFSESRSESAHRREPARHRRTRASPRRPTSASPGTATPTAASSSTGPASSSREISSPRCWRRRSC